MNKEEYANLKSKFLSMVASVPFPLRNQIIAVVENKAVDWNVASEEVKRDTPKAKEILTQMKKICLLENDKI